MSTERDWLQFLWNWNRLGPTRSSLDEIYEAYKQSCNPDACIDPTDPGGLFHLGLSRVRTQALGKPRAAGMLSSPTTSNSDSSRSPSVSGMNWASSSLPAPMVLTAPNPSVR